MRRSCRIAETALLAAISSAVLLGLWQANTQGATDSTADGVDAGTRVDLAEARFVQVPGDELALRLSTHTSWEADDVKPSATRALCVWVRNILSPTPAGRLCVVPDVHATSGVRLRYTTLDHRGRQTGIRELSAVVTRSAATRIDVRLEPAALSLVPGRYRWHVRSRSHGVEDRLPDDGELGLQIALSTASAAGERCFAAAARDPRRRCVNPALRLAVVPTPDDAVLSTNSPCKPVRKVGVLRPCEFGVPRVDARASVALVGDSHAAQWRGAVEQVAQRKRWHGVSITRAGCPLSRATTRLEPARLREACVRWNRQLPRWLRRRPAIHTLFVSEHMAASVVAPRGAGQFETRAAGHRAAWTALPASVRRIVVLRDTPLLGFHHTCVRRARARRRNAGYLCALPRARVLAPDAAVVAARRMRSSRVRVIDLSAFFCSRRRCLPVVGGALVFKDREHMTDVFSTSLGPYLLRAFNEL